MTIFFWICLGIIFYTFLGYGILLFGLVQIKKKKKLSTNLLNQEIMPTCSVIIAAYNEEDYIRQKIKNTLSLKYPLDRLKIYIVTDGSTDKTPEIVQQYPEIFLLHSAKRKGKVDAINRAMELVDTEIVIFTDANTYLNDEALINICTHYIDPTVGGVAGEKKIFVGDSADASTAGESLYWKYESKLKKLDSQLNTAIGAAGELFSIRRILFDPVPESTILDDFIISMRAVQKGFRIIYEPSAYAVELSSVSVKQELKRKIRIAAGGIQAVIELKSLLRVTRHPLLTFQYISHRVLRWTITPFLLLIVFVLNFLIVYENPSFLYKSMWIAQIVFYALAALGFFMEKRRLKLKATFIPYYFCVMNYSVIAGIFRFMKNEQNVIWEKAERKRSLESKTVT